MVKSFFSGGKMLEALKASGLSVGKLLAIGLSVIFALFVLLAFLQFGFIYAIYALVVGRTHLNYLSAKYTQSQIMQGLLVKS